MSKYLKAFNCLIEIYYANKGINPTKKEVIEFRRKLLTKIEESYGKNK